MGVKFLAWSKKKKKNIKCDDYLLIWLVGVNTSNFIIGSIITALAALADSLNPSLAANSKDNESHWS